MKMIVVINKLHKALQCDLFSSVICLKPTAFEHEHNSSASNVIA
jgi:hypothetical protein